MRARLLASGSALVLLGALWQMRVSGRGSPTPSLAPSGTRPSAPGVAREGPADLPVPPRNVFQYADDPDQDPGAAVPPPLAASPPPPLAPTPGPALRLVGLIRRGGTLQAALSLSGEIALLGPGEEAGGYTVVSITDDVVRLRDAQGVEISLSPDFPAP